MGELGLEDIVYAMLPVLALAGLLALAAFWISRRMRMRELAHRERLAMIEKGMMPPAELFPGGPPASILDSTAAAGNIAPPVAANRFRSIGIMLVGLGAALILIIGVAAGQPSIGLGIGGAIAAVGAAMIVNGMVMARTQRPPTHVASRPEPGTQDPGPGAPGTLDPRCP